MIAIYRRWGENRQLQHIARLGNLTVKSLTNYKFFLLFIVHKKPDPPLKVINNIDSDRWDHPDFYCMKSRPCKTLIIATLYHQQSDHLQWLQQMQMKKQVIINLVISFIFPTSKLAVLKHTSSSILIIKLQLFRHERF